MRHEYIGKVTSEEERKREEKRARLDGEWKQARIDAEHARQKLHQAKLLSLKGELISRAHVTKQMTFLAISMRQHLLSIPAQHSRSLLDIAEEHEMRAKARCDYPGRARRDRGSAQACCRPALA
jgi:hypothetical protein